MKETGGQKPTTFSAATWNIQGKPYFTRTPFKKIAPLLERSNVDILCLQEARHVRKDISHFTHTGRWRTVLTKNDRDENVILSRFSIVASGELAFPGLRKRPLENTLWADIQIGEKIVRVYNNHFGIVDIHPADRALQLRLVLDHAQGHTGPTIICGDMNTTIPAASFKRKIVQWFHHESNASLHMDGKLSLADERYIFRDIAQHEGFHEAADPLRSTWCITPFGWELFHLKLDWFLVRDVRTLAVHFGPYVSDHREISVRCSLS